MRWRSRSRARRTEARCGSARRHRSSSARVTVSLPVRRRWSSARRTGVGRPLADPGARPGRAAAGASSSSSAGDRHLAGGRQRGDLGGRGLAGALGDLAAGFLLLAAGLFLRRRASCASSSALLARLFLLDPPAGLFLGPARAPPRRRAPPPGGGDRLRRARRGGAPPRRPCARPAATRDAGRVLLGGQRAGDRRAGGAPARRLRRGRPARAGWARATAGAAGSPRPRFRRAPGRDDALLADLDRHRLRAAMREALAHLAGLDRSAQLQACRRTAASRGASALARWRLARSLQSCASVPSFSCRRTGRRSTRLPAASRSPVAAARSPASFSQIEQQPPAQRPAADRHVHDPVAAERRAKLGRGQHRRRDGRSRPSAASLRAPARRRRPSAHSSSAARPCRTASPTRSNPATARPARRAKPERVDTAPRQQRFEPVGEIRRHRDRPPRRAGEEPASPRRAPLYPGAASTTNPVPAAAPSISGTTSPSGPTTKRSSRGAIAHLAGRDAAALRRRGGLGARLAADALRRAVHVTRRRRLLLRRRRRGSSSASSNQCASRAAMISALASSGSSVAPPLSAPRISTSSSPARSARSSSVLTPFSPSATSMPGVRPSSAARSSSTPSSAVALLVARGRAARGTSRARLLQLGGDLLVEALDRRPDPRPRRRRLPRPS